MDFLINIGANVNSPDSHGWCVPEWAGGGERVAEQGAGAKCDPLTPPHLPRTPLHCAASCNDTAICMALVKHGAAIFATTFSDGSLAIEKCDPFREGYNECFSYLAGEGCRAGLSLNSFPCHLCRMSSCRLALEPLRSAGPCILWQ